MTQIFIGQHPRRVPRLIRRWGLVMFRWVILPWLQRHPNVQAVLLDLEEAVISKRCNYHRYKTIVDDDYSAVIAAADDLAWQTAGHWYGPMPAPAQYWGEISKQSFYPSLKCLYEEAGIIDAIIEREQPNVVWRWADIPRLTGNCRIRSLNPAWALLTVRWCVIIGSRLLSSIKDLTTLVAPSPTNFTPTSGYVAMIDTPNHYRTLSAVAQAMPAIYFLPLNRSTQKLCQHDGANYVTPSALVTLRDLLPYWRGLRVVWQGWDKHQADIPETIVHELKVLAAFYWPRLILLRLTLSRLWAQFHPRIALTAVGFWAPYRLFLDQADRYNAKRVVVAHGNIPRTPAFYGEANYDQILVRGAVEEDNLIRMGIPSSLITVVGQLTDARDVSKDRYLPVQPPRTILVAMQGFGGEMSYCEYAKFITELDGAITSDINRRWIIRLHYQQPQYWGLWRAMFGNRPNVILVTDQPFETLLKNSKIEALVTVFSSTALEAAAHNIPVVTVNFSGMEELLPFSATGLSHEVRMPHALTQVLARPLTPPSRDAYTKFIARSGQATVRSAIDAINQTLP
ncbi:TPA: hypothetical protein DHW58_01680 [Patescibacteria group bacterium]|nr:hypothetical protein [Patescibacteria group bacterium]